MKNKTFVVEDHPVASDLVDRLTDLKIQKDNIDSEYDTLAQTLRDLSEVFKVESNSIKFTTKNNNSATITDSNRYSINIKKLNNFREQVENLFVAQNKLIIKDGCLPLLTTICNEKGFKIEDLCDTTEQIKVVDNYETKKLSFSTVLQKSLDAVVKKYSKSVKVG